VFAPASTARFTALHRKSISLRLALLQRIQLPRMLRGRNERRRNCFERLFMRDAQFVMQVQIRSREGPCADAGAPPFKAVESHIDIVARAPCQRRHGAIADLRSRARTPSRSPREAIGKPDS